MTFIPKTAYIVSHTHWDREWYLAFHEFRVNMLKTVGEVLNRLENDKSFRHFLLDGQAIILEDYLEIYPEHEKRIRDLVMKGVLSIGPWYILPDEFIISPESHIRNLIYGHKVALRFGKVQKVGYMPDSFGHIAQMPQILRQAGIDSFVYTRGNGDEIDELGHEFIWHAPDGSEVIAINQCRGYDNAAALGFDEYGHAMTGRDIKTEKAVEKISRLFEAMGERSNGDIVLLSNGGDHLPPQQGFDRIIDALRNAFPETEFIHADLSRYINAVKNAGLANKTFEGELVRGKLQFILSGVWSSRVYLKQKNNEAQNLLANYLEPISSYVHFMLGCEYPSGLIEYAWKLLLKNHPHDSICGCSIDDVHREMIPRFDGVIHTAHQTITNQLGNLAPIVARKADDDCHAVLCVMNPLPHRRTELIERLVVLQPGTIKPEELNIVDENGCEIPFKTLQKWHIKRLWGVDYRTMLESHVQMKELNDYVQQLKSKILKTKTSKGKIDCVLLVQFEAELPPLGHKLFHLTNKPAQIKSDISSKAVIVDGSSMENEYYRVDVHSNGSFDLLDKKTGRAFHNLNILEDIEDIGDEYDYSPCENSKKYTTENINGKVEIVENSGFKAAIEVSYIFKLPWKINANRKSRTKKLIGCPIRIRISLNSTSPIVDILLEFENNALDHRLRVLFQSQIKTDFVISDGHFYTNKRTVKHPEGKDWLQPPVDTYPQQDFTLIQDEIGGLAIFNKGLIEIEPFQSIDGNTGIALTLLRAVGWLSRDDFPTRKFQNAGPMIPTPDAQCSGKNCFHYAVVSYQGDWINAGIKHLSQRWRVPPIMIQGVEDQSVKSSDGLIETSSNRICITAVRKHEERDTLVVRFYNLTNEPIDEIRYEY